MLQVFSFALLRTCVSAEKSVKAIAGTVSITGEGSMGHYDDCRIPSDKERKEAALEARMHRALEKLPVSAFSVAELAALLVFLGFETKDFFSRDKAIEILEKKLKELKREAAKAKK